MTFSEDKKDHYNKLWHKFFTSDKKVRQGIHDNFKPCHNRDDAFVIVEYIKEIGEHVKFVKYIHEIIGEEQFGSRGVEFSFWMGMRLNPDTLTIAAAEYLNIFSEL